MIEKGFPVYPSFRSTWVLNNYALPYFPEGPLGYQNYYYTNSVKDPASLGGRFYGYKKKSKKSKKKSKKTLKKRYGSRKGF